MVEGLVVDAHRWLDEAAISVGLSLKAITSSSLLRTYGDGAI